MPSDPDSLRGSCCCGIDCGWVCAPFSSSGADARACGCRCRGATALRCGGGTADCACGGCSSGGGADWCGITPGASLMLRRAFAGARRWLLWLAGAPKMSELPKSTSNTQQACQHAYLHAYTQRHKPTTQSCQYMCTWGCSRPVHCSICRLQLLRLRSITSCCRSSVKKLDCIGSASLTGGPNGVCHSVPQKRCASG